MKNIKKKIEDMRIYQTNSLSEVNLKMIKRNDDECIVLDLDSNKYFLCSLKPFSAEKEITVNDFDKYANK